MDRNKEIIKEFYNRNASKRNSSTKAHWKIDIREKFLSIMLNNGCSKLLEIGAGTGQDSLFFMENGMDVTAIDIAENHIEKCIERGIDAHVMDFSSLNFKDNSYDFIYAMNCLLHVSSNEIVSVMTELKRVLKDDGLIFVCQYGGNDFEGILNNNDEDGRFFAFHSQQKFEKIIVNSSLTIKQSGTIDLGEDYFVQYFILKKT